MVLGSFRDNFCTTSWNYEVIVNRGKPVLGLFLFVIFALSCTYAEVEEAQGRGVDYNYSGAPAVASVETTRPVVATTLPVYSLEGAPSSAKKTTETAKKAETEVKPAVSVGTGRYYNPYVVSNAKKLTKLDIKPLDNEAVEIAIVSAPVAEVAKAILGDMFGRRFVIAEDIKASLTVQTAGKVSKKEVLELFEAALSANQLSMKEKNGIISIERGVDRSNKFYSVSNWSPSDEGIVVAQLQYIGSKDMEVILLPLSENGLNILGIEDRNLLVLSGPADQIKNAIDSIKLFDVNTMKGKTIALAPMKAADVDEVINELSAIFELDSEAGSSAIRFVPNPRLRAILIIARNTEYARDALSWIEKLDQAAVSSKRFTQVYYLRNRQASEIKPLLDQLLEGEAIVPSGASSEAVADGETGDQTSGLNYSSAPKIISDDVQNAVLVHGFYDDHENIRAILDDLDGDIKQVLIEATIAEVSINDDLQLGVRWFLENSDVTAGFGTNSKKLGLNSVPGFSAVFQGADIIKALDALASVTDVNVISAPNLMVQDNKEATLSIGDQVPIVRQQVTSEGETDKITNTIEYRDTGVILKVTPNIGRDNRVTLSIDQEISDVTTTTTSGIDSPTIQQRAISTNVIVTNGQTLLLGGIIQQKNNFLDSKIPGLGDIPIAGIPFRDRKNVASSTELVILIRPVIIETSSDASLVTNYWRRNLQRTNSVLTNGVNYSPTELPTMLR